MNVKVVKGDCDHICHSQEQLERFLKAGWTQEVKAPAEATEKKKTTKAK